MESSDNPFRDLVGSAGICLQSNNIIAYRNSDSTPWSLRLGQSELVRKAQELMDIKLWLPLTGVDAEAFVCLCLDLWEETHK